MKDRYYLNDDWLFSFECTDEMLGKRPPKKGMIPVRLPHSVTQTPYDYFDEHCYQSVSCYVRHLRVPAEWKGRRLLLTVEAAAHASELYVNGSFLYFHKCGYTAFTCDITENVIFGGDNVIALKVDSRESLDQPPFGFVIDYMTYGGLYRGVYLDVKNESFISDVFAESNVLETFTKADGALGGNVVLKLRTELNSLSPGMKVRASVREKGSEEPVINVSRDVSLQEGTVSTLSMLLENVLLWDIDRPQLYEITVRLFSGDEPVDENKVVTGFRSAEFRREGFFLNGRKVKIRGLNRHQSYPYVGYAMPESLQKQDADILKNELSLNAVRTSHYPQSPAFIDRCDEIGLMVFTEIPGWQHIGGEDWKNQAVKNTRDMVLQYRNHPSIILWGVRINESADCDELYIRTNEAARSLDPTRQTGGVRCIRKSHLLEDVYTFNDFIHDGVAAGCSRKKDVTSDISKPYLVTEYNGHMFPTKMFDSEYHRLEHALRHTRVLDAVAGQEDIAGSFGWCFSDYNTHMDFGSGDRVCYHGVMDMYRNPKDAAWVYASQGEEDTILHVTSQMDIGEHPTGNAGKVYIITNCDSVKMYKNGVFIKEFFPSGKEFGNLRHPPILIDDYIGARLVTQEGFPPLKARLTGDVINYAAVNSYARLPLKILFKGALAVLLFGMKYSDVEELYNRYITDWGERVSTYRFEGIRNGEIVKVLEKKPSTRCRLDIKCEHTSLSETTGYDASAVRVRAVDENGSQLMFMNDSVRLRSTGPIEIVGPDILQLRGGAGGTYVRTTGKAGDASLTLEGPGEDTYEIKYHIDINKE
ncbi:MAG: glycoside hydrolase family 2 protein [Eubacteriaceae bacterium]|nr:glycoside hydrolase family 2 protein [Eubacteriaceae bacterium]